MSSHSSTERNKHMFSTAGSFARTNDRQVDSIKEVSITLPNIRRDSQRSREIINTVAQELGQEALDIAQKAPDDQAAVINYYISLLGRLLSPVAKGDSLPAVLSRSADKSELDGESKLAGFVVFCLYEIRPWSVDSLRGFQEWARAAKLETHEAAFALSFVREFEQWEPAATEDYALIVKLDRAIIRGARVGAASLRPQSFLKWLEKNHNLIERGYEFLTRTRDIMSTSDRESQLTTSDEEALRDKLAPIGRLALREIGRKYGRSGLNSVRRQIGAPPSPRRRSHLGLGAQFTTEVYNLSERYKRLQPSEREAFKSLLNKIDCVDRAEN